jgi:hypothetical protein
VHLGVFDIEEDAARCAQRYLLVVLPRVSHAV